MSQLFLRTCTATKDSQNRLKPSNIKYKQAIEADGSFKLPSKFCFPSLLSVRSQWENRGVFSGGEKWGERAQRLILRRGQTCFCFLSSVCFMGKKKKKHGRSDTGQIPRNFISHFTCYHLLLKGGEDLERAREGRDKGGPGNEPGGLLRPSVSQSPLACIMQMGMTVTDRAVFAWTLFTRASNGPQTGKSHESDLIIVLPLYTCCFDPFQDT